MYESKTTHHRGIEHRMLSKILRIKKIDVAWYERRIARRMERTPRKVEVLLIFSLSRSMKPRFLPMLRWSFSFLKNGHTFRGECTTLVIIRGRLESVSINRPRARGEPNVIRTAACVTSFLARVRTLQTKSHTSPSVRQYFHQHCIKCWKGRALRIFTRFKNYAQHADHRVPNFPSFSLYYWYRYLIFLFFAIL